MVVDYIHRCRQCQSNIILTGLLYLWNRLRGRNLLAHSSAIIRGAANIQTYGLLQVGLSSPNFVHRHDRALLSIRGALIAEGNCHIGQGCRIDVGPRAVLRIGVDTYVHPLTKIIASNGISIGTECAISWDVSIIDDDFHTINYPGFGEHAKEIYIGDHVWIGAGVTILAGSHIPNGCVVAANSTVRGVFTEENILIAGIPARVIKQNICWSR